MTPLTAATPKPLVTHTLTRTETHSHTHTHTHSLKWRVWNWAGTWNEYSKQLSFSPASSNPFPVNKFASPSFFFSRSSSLPPSSSSSATHSHLPLFSSLTGDGICPSGSRTKCDNTAIMPLIYGSRSLSHNVHTVVTSATDTLCWLPPGTKMNTTLFYFCAVAQYVQQLL